MNLFLLTPVSCAEQVVDGTIFLLLISVDDIFVLADKPEIEQLPQAFIQEYPRITMEYGNIHSIFGHTNFITQWVCNQRHYEKFHGQIAADLWRDQVDRI